MQDNLISFNDVRRPAHNFTYKLNYYYFVLNVDFVYLLSDLKPILKKLIIFKNLIKGRISHRLYH